MHGKKRLDIVMVGILWMQLYQIDIGNLFKDKSMAFDSFEAYILEALVKDQLFPPDHVLLTKM